MKCSGGTSDDHDGGASREMAIDSLEEGTQLLGAEDSRVFVAAHLVTNFLNSPRNDSWSMFITKPHFSARSKFTGALRAAPPRKNGRSCVNRTSRSTSARPASRRSPPRSPA